MFWTQPESRLSTRRAASPVLIRTEAPEINLGAFRGLAFALIFQTVLFLLGGLAWDLFRSLR